VGVHRGGRQTESGALRVLGVGVGGQVGPPGDDLAADDGREAFVAVGGGEVVGEPGEVQGDLVGYLGGANAADGGVQVSAGQVLDRVGGGQVADRERDNLP